MDLFVDFISSSISIFILAYFVFIIARRRRKISFIILSIIFVSDMVGFLYATTQGFALDALILLFFYGVAPTLFAFFLFMTFTGGFGARTVRRRKLKSLSTDIQTKRLTEITSVVVIIVSIIMALLAYFILEEPNFIILGISVISLILGIYMLINVKKISCEKVVLFVGRNKERIFSYDIPKNALKVEIKDFYKNEMYIVDAIGEATLFLEDKKYEKHYLYWIGTGDRIDMKDEIVTEMRSLPYKNHLEHFEKYHYKKVAFQENRNGTADFVKEKLVK